jgi:hypothetical protein
MEELRRLWFMLDSNIIHIMPRYITQIRSEHVGRQAQPALGQQRMTVRPYCIPRDGHTVRAPYTIDRFASALNTLLPRYMANWLDPACELRGGGRITPL